MKKLCSVMLGILLAAGVGEIVSAQRSHAFGGFAGRAGGGYGRGMPDYSNRHGVPVWDVDKDFKNDVFTFVRVIYDSPKYGSGGNCFTDAPESDHNLSFRLQQMTSMKVNPFPVQLRLTDPELFHYPFIYMLEVGRLQFSEEEIVALRRYLLNGGFLMIDDHWGLNEQANFREEIGRVFPEKTLRELPFEHPIFHCVFDLKTMPQVPGINAWSQTGQTFERTDDPLPHYRTMEDDKGRMMFIECANTDMGDGWESEGLNETYFHLFSEKQAYPMGINIIFYAMTH